MEKFKQILLFGILIPFSQSVFGQQTKKECNDIDYLIKMTVNALQNKSDSQYLQLPNYGIMMEVLNQKSATDSTAKILAQQMQKKPQLFNLMFKSNFNELITDIKSDLKTSNFNLEYKEYFIEHKEKDALTDHLTLMVKLIANGERYRIMMYTTKYKDCFYIFEPATPYFTRGW